jgi:hypothetical protein
MAHTLHRFDSPEDIADWSPVDDVVMGGVSHSTMRHDSAGHAAFEGVVSLERVLGVRSLFLRLEYNARGLVSRVIDPRNQEPPNLTGPGAAQPPARSARAGLAGGRAKPPCLSVVASVSTRKFASVDRNRGIGKRRESESE